MNGYLLDTNTISDIIRNPFGPAAVRIEQVGHRGICTSIIVAAELRYGCAKKGSPRLLAKVESILETIPVLPLDIPADSKYSGIRAELEAAGQIIGQNDLLIGAHALALGLTVILREAKRSRRIQTLHGFRDYARNDGLPQ